MKIAVISDIHANQVALESVMNDIPNDVEEIVCCGDVIGYGPRPKQCVEIVRDKCDVFVRGNHDRDMQNPDKYITGSSVYKGLIHAREELTEEQFQWVTGLERKQETDDLLVVHSHPDIVDKYVYPREFNSVGEDIEDYSGVLLGHTHHQHAEVVDGTLVLNPGSVGQPRDGNRDAAYAVVETDDNDYELNRVPYNIDKVETQIESEDLPSKSSDRLYIGE